jgi:hypothetical protein
MRKSLTPKSAVVVSRPLDFLLAPNYYQIILLPFSLGEEAQIKESITFISVKYCGLKRCRKA